MAITKVTTPVTGFESNVDIGLKIPVGTNSNLPTGVEGMIRNDTDEDSSGAGSTTAITFYNGTDWKYFNSTESPDVVYPTSLKMYLNASDTASYPGTGTTWFDLTSNGNNGTISNAPWSSSGYFQFNGSSSYVSTSLTWPGNTTLSYSAWGYLTSLSVNQFISGDFDSNGANSQFRFYVKITSSNQLQVGTNNGGAGTFYDFGIMSSYLNTWANITVTVSGTQVKAYVNDTQLGNTAAQSTALSAGVQPTQIGVYGPGSNKQNFNGYISKVRFFTDVITSAEITALNNEGR